VSGVLVTGLGSGLVAGSGALGGMRPS
jgi:hypothetical protein